MDEYLELIVFHVQDGRLVEEDEVLSMGIPPHLVSATVERRGHGCQRCKDSL